MIVRPELKALRSNDAPQRLTQARLGAALNRWRSGPAVATATDELARFGSGIPLDDLPLLASLFSPREGTAPHFVQELMSVFLSEMAADPLAQIPLRASSDDLRTSIQLIRSGATALTLQAIDGTRLARRPAPVSASFSASETWEYVLAGTAEADRVILTPQGANRAAIRREALLLAPGHILHRFGTREVLQYREMPGWLVTLKLQRRDGSAQVAREHLLESGELVHQSAGSPRDSRLELTAALLARMGRTDAAPLLSAMAEEQAAPSLRWQVLRECLGLDAGTGFAALCRIAGDPGDALAAPAAALRRQLLNAHPALAAADPLEGAEPCPA